MNTSRRSFWKGQPEHLREMFVLLNPGREPIRCTLWSHPHGYELRLFVGGSLLETRVNVNLGTIGDIVSGWKSGLQTRGWSESQSRPRLPPAKSLHSEDGQVIGYLDHDGESFFDNSGEQIGRLEDDLIYTAEGEFFGYIDEGKWIYDQCGHRLGYMA
jgi:hypothetical protein